MHPPIPRHAGLDWLRIAAFGLLILYHIGLYFGPWGWHIDAPHPATWLVYPLLALNPWRMILLFLVSGYASRAVLARGSPATFLHSRAVRLLLPLAFAVLVVVPPQPWVERVNGGTYHHGLLHYWLHDYLDPADRSTPALDHLWFVAYIAAYSLVTAVLAWVLPHRWQDALQEAFVRWMRGGRMLLIPVAWVLFVRLVLFPGEMPTNHLLRDTNGHLIYYAAFLFGFAWARAPDLRAHIPSLGRWAGVLVLIGYATIVGPRLILPAEPAPMSVPYLIERLGVAVTSWSMIVLLLGLAERIRDTRSRWRARLNEAVFPCYIAHQTAIILIAWWIRPYQLSNFTQFILILSGTCAICWAFYMIGRACGPFRPLFGLAPPPRKMFWADAKNQA